MQKWKIGRFGKRQKWVFHNEVSLQCWGVGKYSPVSKKNNLESLCSSQSGFFCLGSPVEKSFNFGSTQKERLDPC